MSPVAVRAQCLLCTQGTAGADSAPSSPLATPRAAERPLSITIDADLDFARLVAGPSGGSVRIDPASGQAVVQGGIAAIGGSGFSGRGRIEGTPGATVRIDLPREVVLQSTTGGVAHVRDIVSDLPLIARINADGRLDFAFGGRLEVSGDTDGDFRGRIAITVSYE